MNEFWKYWLDVRAWGLGRPLLFSLPTLYLTWSAISTGAGGLSIVALVGLWIAMVLEWVRWKSGRTA